MIPFKKQKTLCHFIISIDFILYTMYHLLTSLWEFVVMNRFIAILCSLFITSTFASSQTPTCTDHQCIMVVDAGSSGSRAHIYAYDLDEHNSPIHVNEVWNKKVKPGLATIDANSSTLSPYLNGLFANSPEQGLPVYFYATAGMRLLPQAKQKKYYDEITKWFSQHSEWRLVEAKTLTGNQEGLYDWLSVNYHMGSFDSPTNQTIGVMDMGGASVQIAFPIVKNSNINNQSQVEFDLYGTHYNLYVHSFLGLGQTEMSHQFLNDDACFSNNYPLPDGASGSGDALACEHEVASLMNNVHEVNQAVQPLLNANPVSTWYSIGGLTYLAESPLFHFDTTQLTSQSLLEQGNNSICQQQWDDLDKQYPNDEFLYEYCLFSAYYYALMVDGYGIAPEQQINYLPSNQNVDWTLGVVLYHPASKS
jgi:hypothetical protein